MSQLRDTNVLLLQTGGGLEATESLQEALCGHGLAPEAFLVLGVGVPECRCCPCSAVVSRASVMLNPRMLCTQWEGNCRGRL